VCDQNEIFGLPWIAEHEDPFLVLFFFYFWTHKRNPTFGTLFFIGETVKSNLNRIWDNNNLIRTDKGLQLSDNFVSPFPAVISNEDLKAISYKIISKLERTKYFRI
jgi:hypothetical protein